MPVVLLLAFLLFIILASIALLPLSLVQRYRVGTTRRAARGWFITLNLVAVTMSAAIFLIAAGLTSTWVPNAFTYSVAGLGLGCLLGVLGLMLTRWERTAGGLHYTPNRLLVLFVTFLVTARILYGFWRSWRLWSAGLDGWSAAFGIAGSMGAGAVVLGYYLTYWIGVRRQLARARTRV